VRVTAEAHLLVSRSYAPAVGIPSEALNGNTMLTIEPAIPLNPGSYSTITINVDGNGSWAAINGVSLLTSECP
jgi:hypothetical protein